MVSTCKIKQKKEIYCTKVLEIINIKGKIMARSCLKETGKDDCHTEIEQAGRRTR